MQVIETPNFMASFMQIHSEVPYIYIYVKRRVDLHAVIIFYFQNKRSTFTTSVLKHFRVRSDNNLNTIWNILMILHSYVE